MQRFSPLGRRPTQPAGASKWLMPMTILLAGYPFAALGDDAVGGAEQILTILQRGLARAGHRTLVVGGETRGHGQLTERELEHGRRCHAAVIREALDRVPVDLVHMHGVDFHSYLPQTLVPVLVTLHLPQEFYQGVPSYMHSPAVFFNYVSNSQKRAFPMPSMKTAVIPNGIEVERFERRYSKRGFTLSLGRVCPEKGFHFALEAAKMANVDWVLGGQVFSYESHRKYFAEILQPCLDGRRRYIGPVGFRAKQKLLAQARCLLIPSTAAETSSLVAMEALASGTPVIALRSGALPEIVEHRRTGYIVANADEMAQAIGMINQIDSDVCRCEARNRFSGARMVANYINLYQSLLTQHPTVGV